MIIITENAPDFSPIMNLLAIISIIITIEKTNYWGIGYNLGWLVAYLLIGSAFLDASEFILSLLVFLGYFARALTHVHYMSFMSIVNILRVCSLMILALVSLG